MQDKIYGLVLRDIEAYPSLSDGEIMDIIENYVMDMGRACYISVEEKEKLVKKVYYGIRKMDVLQELLDDTTVTEIMVNGPDRIFVEREGRLYGYPEHFHSREKLEDVIQQIVAKVNRMVNEANPIVDVRLPDGSRVNIVLPPVAVDGPVVTIRKFPKKVMDMQDLVALGALDDNICEFLKKLVKAKYNIFISGGTGSGKTTFLNALSRYIPQDERIITIEDSAELKITKIPNLVRLEVRNANLEGKNEISIRDLLKSALRMRPDRIILGEVRDAAACELLGAMNTGHDGSLSTGHANSPKDMLSRLETLVLTGMDIPLQAVRNQIASAIDIVIQLGRLRDKSRRVIEIVEVLGVCEGEIKLNPLYYFHEEGEDEKGRIIGGLKACGSKLQNVQKLHYAGYMEEDG